MTRPARQLEELRRIGERLESTNPDLFEVLVKYARLLENSGQSSEVFLIGKKSS